MDLIIQLTSACSQPDVAFVQSSAVELSRIPQIKNAELTWDLGSGRRFRAEGHGTPEEKGGTAVRAASERPANWKRVSSSESVLIDV